MQEWDKSLRDFIEHFTDHLFDYLIAFIHLIIVFVPDHKTALLFYAVVSSETHLKKFLAILYRDTRPGLNNSSIARISCYCIYGDPSGH